MFMLYSLLSLMTAAALGLIYIPFYKKNNFKMYFLICLIVVIFTFGLYQFSGDKPGLKYWFEQGESHYILQEKFNELGGIEGIISRIEKKLEKNPRDAQGWFILGKLYFAKHDYAAAVAALSSAHELLPDDTGITKYYDMAVEKSNTKD